MKVHYINAHAKKKPYTIYARVSIETVKEPLHVYVNYNGKATHTPYTGTVQKDGSPEIIMKTIPHVYMWDCFADILTQISYRELYREDEQI